MTIPTALTWFRIILIPFFVFAYYLPFQGSHFLAAALFALAAFTDWLDGYLARSLAQSSAFGAFLDPVADKLIVAAALVLLVGELPYLTLAAIVIIGREIVISALREWMAELGQHASMAVNRVGKAKTCIQMVAILVLLMYQRGFFQEVLWLGYFLIYIAMGLTLWSMAIYWRLAFAMLSKDQ